MTLGSQKRQNRQAMKLEGQEAVKPENPQKKTAGKPKPTKAGESLR